MSFDVLHIRSYNMLSIQLYTVHYVIIVVALVPAYFYSQKNTMSGILDNLGHESSGRAVVPEPGPRQAAPRQVTGTDASWRAAGGYPGFMWLKRCHKSAMIGNSYWNSLYTTYKHGDDWVVDDCFTHSIWRYCLTPILTLITLVNAKWIVNNDLMVFLVKEST